jgi:hypothetical protein
MGCIIGSDEMLKIVAIVAVYLLFAMPLAILCGTLIERDGRNAPDHG